MVQIIEMVNIPAQYVGTEMENIVRKMIENMSCGEHKGIIMFPDMRLEDFKIEDIELDEEV